MGILPYQIPKRHLHPPQIHRVHAVGDPRENADDFLDVGYLASDDQISENAGFPDDFYFRAERILPAVTYFPVVRVHLDQSAVSGFYGYIRKPSWMERSWKRDTYGEEFYLGDLHEEFKTRFRNMKFLGADGRPFFRLCRLCDRVQNEHRSVSVLKSCSDRPNRFIVCDTLHVMMQFIDE